MKRGQSFSFGKIMVEDDKKERFVAPWASGENLRVIEKDVLIPNLMKKKAKVLCKEYMDSKSMSSNSIIK